MAIWQLAVDMRAKGLLQPAFLRVTHGLSYFAIRRCGDRVTLPAWPCDLAMWQCDSIWSRAPDGRAGNLSIKLEYLPYRRVGT